MSKIFSKKILSFILILQITTKPTNIFSYSITTYFIPNYKSYNSNFNPHSIYQTCPKFCQEISMENNEATNKVVN